MLAEKYTTPTLLIRYKGTQTYPSVAVNDNQKISVSRISHLGSWNNYNYHYTLYKVDDCVIEFSNGTTTSKMQFCTIDGLPYVKLLDDSTAGLMSYAINSLGLEQVIPTKLYGCYEANVFNYLAMLHNKTQGEYFPMDENGNAMIWYNNAWVSASSVGATPTQFYYNDSYQWANLEQGVGGLNIARMKYTIGGTSTTATTETLQAGIYYPYFICAFDYVISDYKEYTAIDDGLNDGYTLQEGYYGQSEKSGGYGLRYKSSVVKSSSRFENVGSAIRNAVGCFFRGIGNLVRNAGYCLIFGAENTVLQSNNSATIGHSNYLYNATIDGAFGYGNLVKGTSTDHRGNFVFGGHNYNGSAKCAFQAGYYTDVTSCSAPSIALGQGVALKNNNTNAMVAMGQYNSTKANVLEAVGNGTDSSHLSDARLLTTDGVEKCNGWMPMTTVTAAPTTAPTVVGLWQYDSTNKCFYIATGTSAATDWKKISLASI